MGLSKNFTLDELCKTNTEFPNVPDEKEKTFLKLLAVFLLQPIRDEFGHFDVSSGFRSVRVNKEVGGSTTSQHPEGQAGDGRPKYACVFEVYEWIVNESGLDFGQCIIYPDEDKPFIHISLPRLYKPNNQALICTGKEYLAYTPERLKTARGQA